MKNRERWEHHILLLREIRSDMEEELLPEGVSQDGINTAIHRIRQAIEALAEEDD